MRDRMSRIYWRGRFIDYPLRLADVVRKVGPVELARCASSYALALARRPLRRRREPRRSRSGSATASGGASSSCSSRATPRRSGACRRRRSAPSGPPSGSARCRSRASCAPRCSATAATCAASSSSFTTRGSAPARCGRRWRRRSSARAARSGSARGSTRLELRDGRVAAVHAGGERVEVADVISSLALRDVVALADPPAPAAVRRAAAGLRYRDFLTVALVVEGEDLFPDNWIYIHDPHVRVGRIQNFRAWSEAMVPDAGRTCVGMEYFCFEGDALWNAGDDELVARATRELEAIGLAPAAARRDRARRAGAEGLSDLRRRLRGARRHDPRLAGAASPTSSRSAATGCTATTTPITRCSPPCARSRTRPAARRTTSGRSTPTASTTRRRGRASQPYRVAPETPAVRAVRRARRQRAGDRVDAPLAARAEQRSRLAHGRRAGAGARRARARTRPTGATARRSSRPARAARRAPTPARCGRGRRSWPDDRSAAAARRRSGARPRAGDRATPRSAPRPAMRPTRRRRGRAARPR